MAKHKLTKQQQKQTDQAENSKFIWVLAGVTIVLMVLMYFLFS